MWIADCGLGGIFDFQFPIFDLKNQSASVSKSQIGNRKSQME